MKRTSALSRGNYKRLHRTPQETNPIADDNIVERRADRKEGLEPKKPSRTMKSRGPKTTKIRQSARGEECTLMLPGICNFDPETVVWAHSNRSQDGKGAGLKSEDDKGAYACFCCHAVYDRQRKRPEGLSLEYVEAAFTAGMSASRAILVRRGLITAKESCESGDSSSLHRMPTFPHSSVQC